MIYTIFRTSDFLGKNKPCEKAQLTYVGQLYHHK